MSEAAPQQPLPPPGKDRYPRMVLVCIGISATLFVVIVAALAVDFALRAQMVPPEEHVETFGSMMEAPREAYKPPQ